MPATFSRVATGPGRYAAGEPAMSAAAVAGHLPRGRDQADQLPAVLGALADRPHARDARAQRVVDEDAAVELHAHALGQLDLGHDARGDDHEVGGDRLTVVQLHAVVVDRRGHALAQHVDALPAQRALEHPAGGGVELALHQPLAEVDDGDRDAAVGDRARGLEPEQAAADHDGAPRAVGAAADGADVVARAERDRALDALDRRQERARAGGQDERVVGDRRRSSVVATPVAGVDDRAGTARCRARGTSACCAAGGRTPRDGRRGGR